MQKLIPFVRQNVFLVLVCALALGAGLWFATDLFLDFLYFNDPRHQDVALKGWMTPRYVVMTYDLPRPYVAEVLNLTTPEHRGMPMRDIAAGMGITVEDLTEVVRAAAADFRANNP